jgi:DNA-binding HxlR family transcriptional regulator
VINVDNKNFVCSLDYGMSLIKGKWKAVIICHLKESPTRFLELQRKLPGISQKVLTENLKKMENDKIVKKIVFPEIPPRVEYSLTGTGAELFKILNNLQNWSNSYIEEFKN